MGPNSGCYINWRYPLVSLLVSTALKKKKKANPVVSHSSGGALLASLLKPPCLASFSDSWNGLTGWAAADAESHVCPLFWFICSICVGRQHRAGVVHITGSRLCLHVAESPQNEVYIQAPAWRSCLTHKSWPAVEICWSKHSVQHFKVLKSWTCDLHAPRHLLHSS